MLFSSSTRLLLKYSKVTKVQNSQNLMARCTVINAYLLVFCHQRRKFVYNFGRDRIRENFRFFRDVDRGPVNINGMGMQTTQISIIHQLHRGHIWGQSQELSNETRRREIEL